MSQHFHLVARRRGVGDTLAITPLIRDFKLAYPDKRLSLTGTAADEFFRYDPRIEPHSEGAVDVLVDYAALINRSGGLQPDRSAGSTDTSARYLLAAHEAFERATGYSVPRGPARPDLALSPEELTSPDPEPYFVIAVGQKLDLPLKGWLPEYATEVVRRTQRERGWRWKQVGITRDSHYPHVQPLLPEAENLLDKTSIRQLIRLIAHAEGVVCLVSLSMLIASALRTPCVVIGGGREDPWLHAGNGTRYLDTLGQLFCCLDRGCRRWSALPGRTQEEFGPNWKLCLDPVGAAGRPGVGRCMTMITPTQVITELIAAKEVDVRGHYKLKPFVGFGVPVSLPVINQNEVHRGSD